MSDIVVANRALLIRLLPHEQPESLEVRLGQFHAVVVGADRVVCLPRTRAAAGRLPVRAALLKALADIDCGFPVPEPMLNDGAELADVATPYLMLTRIPGEPLAADALTRGPVLATVATQLAALLSRLVDFGGDARARAVLPPARAGRWQHFAMMVRSRLFPLMSPRGRDRAERQLANLDHLADVSTAVVHGDLGAENLMWRWAGDLPTLSGIIDWDDVSLGDPAEDLAALMASYGPRLTDSVLERLDWDDPTLDARIETIRGTFALQQALSAIGDGDDAELADGLVVYR